SNDGATGRVYLTLTVPDFARDDLSLSGVAIGRAAATDIGGRETLSGLLPFAPTSERRFERRDKVGALLRVHQSPRQPSSQVTVTTRVVDRTGAERVSSSSVLPAAAFLPQNLVEHR